MSIYIASMMDVSAVFGLGKLLKFKKYIVPKQSSHTHYSVQCLTLLYCDICLNRSQKTLIRDV